ncbi:MAG: hypothetical protein JXX28_08595 [Deltaproteobacteria bacterium]|nr:hypothetical protein [Deltaproteobacteria bacterium]
MTTTASQLFGAITTAVRANLPPGVSPAYLEGLLVRHRAGLHRVLEQGLAARQARQEADAGAPQELWLPARRAAADLAAMRLAASTPPQAMIGADRAVLAAYSGWGGISLDKVRDRFPAGFPAPEARGLYHEDYTPGAVTGELARVIHPLLPELAGPAGTVLTLEPSAGIVRFVRSLSGPGFEAPRWLVVEWSALSARMLQAIRPVLAVYQGPLERWIRERGDASQGRLNLVVANPPCGQRGASVTEDPVRAYREKAVYAYFLRRGLDLVAPEGLGVFLIPASARSPRSQAGVGSGAARGGWRWGCCRRARGPRGRSRGSGAPRGPAGRPRSDPDRRGERPCGGRGRG